MPLVFRPGAAEVAFNVAVAAWLVFELVMRVRQRLRARGSAPPDPTAFVLMPALVAAALGSEYENFAAGRKRLVPGVW